MLSRYTQIFSLYNWRRGWFLNDLLHADIVFWNNETISIQIHNGLLGHLLYDDDSRTYIINVCYV